jgi:hypothetical protein
MECPQEDSAVPGVVMVTIGIYPDIRCQQHSSRRIWMTDD